MPSHEKFHERSEKRRFFDESVIRWFGDSVIRWFFLTNRLIGESRQVGTHGSCVRGASWGQKQCGHWAYRIFVQGERRVKLVWTMPSRSQRYESALHWLCRVVKEILKGPYWLCRTDAPKKIKGYPVGVNLYNRRSLSRKAPKRPVFCE